MNRCGRKTIVALLLLLPWNVWGEGAALDVPRAQASFPALVLVSDPQKPDKDIEPAKKGADEAKRALAFRFDEYTAAPGDDLIRRMTAIADAGNSLIILVGMHDAASIIHLAERYPDRHFVVVDAPSLPSLANVQALKFKDEEGAFLIGIIAAQTSKSGEIGFIGNTKVASITPLAQGFDQGAHYARRDVKVLHATLGNVHDDPSNAARAATLAQFQQGADVVFANLGGADLGVLKAAHEAGKLAIGSDYNQNGVFPGSVLTSFLRRVDLAVLYVLREERDGHWQPGVQYLSAAEGFLDYAVDGNNRSLISKETIDTVETAKDLMSRGRLVVGGAEPAPPQR